jgi:site-specific DNA recombinase
VANSKIEIGPLRRGQINSKRHLNRLARLAWLAPDIISDILDGRQPPHLTGRYLLRCGDVPLDWSSQRAFLGFA